MTEQKVEIFYSKEDIDYKVGDFLSRGWRVVQISGHLPVIILFERENCACDDPMEALEKAEEESKSFMRTNRALCELVEQITLLTAKFPDNLLSKLITQKIKEYENNPENY